MKKDELCGNGGTYWSQLVLVAEQLGLKVSCDDCTKNSASCCMMVAHHCVQYQRCVRKEKLQVGREKFKLSEVGAKFSAPLACW